MFSSKRPLTRTLLFLFILASLTLISCGTGGSDTNWPGLSTDGEKVYVAYGKHIVAYDVADQRQLWIFPQEASRASLYAAPAVNEDGRVVFGDYGISGGMFAPKIITSIYAVENGTGSPPATNWMNNTSAHGKAVAPALQVGDKVYVGTTDSMLVALNATDGTELWRFEESEEAIWGQPVYRDGTVYITSVDGKLFAINASNGEKKWEYALEGAIAGGVALNDDLLYVVDFAAHVHALSVNTGEEQWQAVVDDSTWATPIYADGVVYLTDISGNIYALNALNGDQLWRQTMPYPLQTSPLVDDGVVYITGGPEGQDTEGMISAYAADSGELIWQKLTTSPLHTTPVAVGDAIITVKHASAVYSLVAFDVKTGTERWSYVLPE